MHHSKLGPFYMMAGRAAIPQFWFVFGGRGEPAFSSLCCFYSHVKKVLEIILQFELLEGLAKKRHIFCSSWTDCPKMVWECVLCISVR